ncbi:HAD hydrolase-like protein, partial [Acinetobacter pittii]
MKSQACIFDLDGTLLDTLQDLANSVNIALEDFNQPVRTIEEVRAFVGNG